MITILAAFLCLGVCYLFSDSIIFYLGYSKNEIYNYLTNTGFSNNDIAAIMSGQADANLILEIIYERFGESLLFSTYYINMSIFLAFAIVYPEMRVLLMFVIPIKVKWLGILDLVLLGYSFWDGNVFSKFSIGAALLNIAIFYLTIRNLSHLKPSEIKRRVEFQHKVQKAKTISKHKCAICGQTEDDDPNLEFRFCSKCNGNYEYCSRHLYTHEHVK